MEILVHQDYRIRAFANYQGSVAYIKHRLHDVALKCVLPCISFVRQAIVFTVLNAIMLAIRIRDENSALRM